MALEERKESAGAKSFLLLKLGRTILDWSFFIGLLLRLMNISREKVHYSIFPLTPITHDKPSCQSV